MIKFADQIDTREEEYKKKIKELEGDLAMFQG
jgi:hypothetical protein